MYYTTVMDYDCNVGNILLNLVHHILVAKVGSTAHQSALADAA